MKDWDIIEVHHLEDFNGQTTRNTQSQDIAFRYLIGCNDGLIFIKIERLARNTKKLVEIDEIYEEHGASLITFDE